MKKASRNGATPAKAGGPAPAFRFARTGLDDGPVTPRPPPAPPRAGPKPVTLVKSVGGGETCEYRPAPDPLNLRERGVR